VYLARISSKAEIENVCCDVFSKRKRVSRIAPHWHREESHRKSRSEQWHGDLWGQSHSIAYDQTPDHIVLGKKLVHVEPGGLVCQGCKLFAAMACPGMRAMGRVAIWLLLPPLAACAVSAAAAYGHDDAMPFFQVAKHR